MYSVNQGDFALPHRTVVSVVSARQKKRKTLRGGLFASFVPGHEGLGGQWQWHVPHQEGTYHVHGVPFTGDA
jgi:hypothetical protein